MATRSTIAIEFADGTVQQVYCHWDGYLENNGRILQESYMDPFKVRELIDLGDISGLREEIGVKHPFSSYEIEGLSYDEYKANYGNMTTFYGRDRGEDGVSARKFADFADYKDNHSYEEFEYILRQVDGKAVWFVNDHGDGYVELTRALEQVKETA